MAIPLFVKVRPIVAEKMGLSDTRFKTADGNYILRQSDFLVFGPLHKLGDYAAAVGGVILRDAEAASNQRGDINTPLPQPKDPEYIAPETDDVNAPEEVVDQTDSSESDEDTNVIADEGAADDCHE